MKCRKNLAQTDPVTMATTTSSLQAHIKWLSAGSEKDKAVDFKCGTQLQTYNTHKMTNFPTEEAWPKCSIYRLPENGVDENVEHRIPQKMREIWHDYQYGTLKIPQKDLQIGSPSTRSASLRLRHATNFKIERQMSMWLLCPNTFDRIAEPMLQ